MAQATKDKQDEGKTEETRALHELLLEGIDESNIKSRPNGTVHTIHAPDGKTTVAEICVGKRATRLNFRQVPTSKIMQKEGKGIELVGKSKTWLGQGVKLTPENVGQARTLLLAVLKASPQAEPTASDAASGSRQSAAEAERQRIEQMKERETANAGATA